MTESGNPLMRCRRAGVLLHPTSLPSGRLDDGVERFLDFMQAQRLRVWQMLPLSIPDPVGSPYQSRSAFAADPALLDLWRALPAEPVDPAALRDYRARQAGWIEDYARFEVLHRLHEGRPWQQWPEALRHRDPAALAAFDREYRALLEREVLRQFLLDRRWRTIRREATARDILLLGDIPIFVALDSADVWAHQDQFLLDGDGQPEWVAGVPPDYFSETGQRWGNPHYDWARMQADGFGWWKARLRHKLEWFDCLRLDHFRGLQASWMIPASAETAVEGHWQAVPGEALLAALREALGGLPILAEDLGVITPEVEALRQGFGLPGMAVLQFAFDAFEDNPHKPWNIGPDRVVYTGTHDNDTTLGWYQGLDPEARRHVSGVLGSAEDAMSVLQTMIDTALDTRAGLAMFPMQDLLGLGSEARMNVPGEAEGNWNWRFDWAQIEAAGARLARLRERIEQTGRADAC